MVSEPSSIVPVYCRYVHTDRWLLTHLDSSWTISQVKQHLLTKIFSTHAPPPRKPARAKRDRPLSPITFSSHGHSDNESDSDYQSAEENGSVLDTLDDVVDDGEFYRYKYAPASRPAAHSSATLVPPAEASLPSPTNFTLISFSTGQLFEDRFHLSWYALSSYELLEFYPRGEAFIALPRHNLEAYVRPYFEARVWALRFVGDDLSAEYHAELERPKSKGKSKGKERERRTGSGSGPAAGDGCDDVWGGDSDETKRKLERKLRKKMEWRERWVVVHQGMFKLCRSRSDPRPAYTAPFTALLALRGGEYLHPRTTSALPQTQDSSLPSSSTSTPLSSPSPARSHLQPFHDPMKQKLDASPRDGSTPNAGRRIVCAKFRAGPHPPPHSPAVTHAVASGAGAGEDRAEAGGWWRRPSRDASAMETFGKKDGRTAFGANSEGSTSRDKLGMGMGMGMSEEDEGSVWIIMDMLNDTVFDDFLRVLHRHAPASCTSSFTARLLSTTEGSTPEVGYVFPPPGGSPYNVSPGLPGSAPRTSATTLTDSPHRKAKFVPDPKSSPYSGKAGVPYPEWRHTAVQRARRAGIGPVGRAMELVIFGGDDGDESPADEDDLLSYIETPQYQESPVVSPKRPALAKRPSMNSQVDLSPTLWRDYLNDDSDSDSDGESEQSEQEWEGWMADIPRQRRIQADTMERDLRHLTPDIEGDEDEDDGEIPWIQDEPMSDDAAGVPASDDGAADEPAFSMDEPTTGKSRWDLFPQSRTITTYSSADSLIRKTIRPSRSRPRILGGSKSMAGVEFPGVRARSPLSSQVRASDDQSTSPGSGTNPSSRPGLPVRIPIPIRMRMTSVRGTQVEIGTSPPETATSPRLPSFLRKGASTNESAPASQDTSPSQEKSQKLPAGPAPPSLVLTIPEPQASGSSPSSLESIKFVTPDSDDGGD